MRIKATDIFSVIIGGAAAVFIMLGVQNGAFAALYTGVAQNLGLSTTTTTAIQPVASGTSNISTPTDTDTNTASAAVGAVTSNWAGYVATGARYTAITGSWKVPTITASDAAQTADATWIGIGGTSSDDLIQAGTEAIDQNGQVQYVAFYEELPAYAQTISTITVSPGDTIEVSLRETSTDVWTLTMSDSTTGESYSNTLQYASSHSSAEWIEEAPSTAAGIIALDNFGSVSFSDATVTADGASQPLSASGATTMTMQNSAGDLLTSVSTLSTDGQGFLVSRTSASSSALSSGGDGFRREPGINRFGNGRI